MFPKEAYIYQTGHDQVATEMDDNPLAKWYELDLKQGVEKGYFKSEPTPDGSATVYTALPNNGVFVPIKGATFPMKQLPDCNTVFAANLVKSMVIEPAKLFSKWYLLPFLLLVNKQQAVDVFNRVALKAISVFLLRDEYLTDFTREFKKFLKVFMVDLGFTEESSETFSMIVSQLIEFDSAYRFRLEDMFSSMSKSNLHDDPRNEIKSILKTMRSREVRPGGKGEAIHRKFSSVGFLIRTALLIPRVRKALQKAIISVDFKKLCLDEIDTYWVCMRNDYNFMGMTEEERSDYMRKKDWSDKDSFGTPK